MLSGSGFLLYKRIDMINEIKETHNQNVDQQNGFHHLLDEMSIPYQEEENCLRIGEVPEVDGWVLILSVNVGLVETLIRKVCLLLYNANVPFRVVKDESRANRGNDFWLGLDEVGRMITIYTGEEHRTRQLIPQLVTVTHGLVGPEVHNTIRVGEIIYVGHIHFEEKKIKEGDTILVSAVMTPEIKKFPFKVEKKYQYWKRKRILNRRFVPLVMLGRSPKGDLLKAVDLKGFSFNWCFIKEGKYHVFTDRHGRYIKDRLLWQAKVLQALQGKVPIPKFIDYFEQGEESYLVMELLEGIDMDKKIREIYKERIWDNISPDEKMQLIQHYLEVLSIIEKMHELGYVHRDATANNFMLLASGEMRAIDLELTFSLSAHEPNPPFTLGSLGYVSPEQVRVETPTVKDDVYSMGALLLYILTGVHPSRFINREHEVNREEIDKYPQVVPLLEVILSCVDPEARNRPMLADVKAAVTDFFLK